MSKQPRNGRGCALRTRRRRSPSTATSNAHRRAARERRGDFTDDAALAEWRDLDRANL